MRYSKIAIFLAGIVGVYETGFAQTPDCTGADRWPANSAFVALKNAGLTDNTKIDFPRTTVIRIASEALGKGVYRQVHLVTFTERGGTTLRVITVNDASRSECSESGVEVFVVSQRLGESITRQSTETKPSQSKPKVSR